jgi:hypothetical protein
MLSGARQCDSDSPRCVVPSPAASQIAPAHPLGSPRRNHAQHSPRPNPKARPNEPEILLNGRPAAGLANQPTGNGLTFKEGAQVRLDCQSAGGKPAPRIEWLNLTTWTGTGGGGASPTATMNEPLGNNSMKFNDDNDDQSMGGQAGRLATGQQQQPELAQLMRLHWPIKRATYSVNSYDSFGQQQVNNNINQIGPQQQPIPVTSSSITITLSRYDFRSRFACLVLPAVHSSISGGGSGSSSSNNNNDPASGELQLLAELPAGLRNARALNRAASQVAMLTNTRLQTADGPMLKWIQLSVLGKSRRRRRRRLTRAALVGRSNPAAHIRLTAQILLPIQLAPTDQPHTHTTAKPTSVSMRVLELSPGAAEPTPVRPAAAPAQPVRPAGSSPARQPFYSLQPNRLYAIQCVVENSRPRSQVVWFNRTAPVELSEPTVELRSADYLVPSPRARQQQRHRLSSFVRHTEQESGTFR